MSTYPIPSEAITPCADKGDLMVPDHRPNESQITRAKAVCRGCEFTLGCLTWALDNLEEGVWGSTSDAERAEIHRRRGTKGEKPSLAGLVRMGNSKVEHGTSVGVDYHRKRYEDQCALCVEFTASRKGKEPAVRCPDCGKSLLPQSLRKHQSAACMRATA